MPYVHVQTDDLAVYHRERLRTAKHRYDAADSALEDANRSLTYEIKQAKAAGGLTAGEISEIIGLSRQRVHKRIAG